LKGSSSAVPLSTSAIAASILSARSSSAVGLQPGGQGQHEIVDRAHLAAVEIGRHIFDHPEPEILQRGHRIGQAERAGRADRA
jgi:hypothetical protein